MRVAYFDGPGGTQVPRVVVEAMSDYLVHHNANTHWSFPTSAETDAALLQARQALADFLNASPAEIVFGNNMTTLTFHLARALGRGLGPDDAIIVTELDHHANIDPWRALERERGVTILQVRMIPETGELDWNDLDRCLADHRTRLLAIGAASNALGTINDVSRAVAMANEAGPSHSSMPCTTRPTSSPTSRHGAVTSWPARHTSSMVRTSACSTVSTAVWKSWRFSSSSPRPIRYPTSWKLGTQNHEGIVGAAAAVDYLASLAIERTGIPPLTRRQRLQAVYEVLHDRESALAQRLWDGLCRIPGVRLYGPPPPAPRTPTLALTVANLPAVDVCRHLAHRGIFASHGNFYAMTVTARLGLARDGLVRVGCALYTTDDEVDRVIEGIRAIASSVH